eukprot:TRINITY_DN309_c0_g2_i1.p3 TRINITY_DN309_c0_g2~~TRINITY_DN309_c0_g2_i1.p3  ORF type:complete len:121 (+),score=30.38 TRINITY_DN309_c0_g2_i1:69-431(+)
MLRTSLPLVRVLACPSQRRSMLDLKAQRSPTQTAPSGEQPRLPEDLTQQLEKRGFVTDRQVSDRTDEGTGAQVHEERVTGTRDDKDSKTHETYSARVEQAKGKGFSSEQSSQSYTYRKES